jgi:predicted ATPase/DNA-binding winged helix-turn-helix (wHTH) protein
MECSAPQFLSPLIPKVLNMTSSDLVLQFGPFRLLPQPRLLLKGGAPVRLGSRAREILFFLVERAGRIVSKTELIKRVWPDTVVEEGTLRVHIAALRKALDSGKGGMRCIENVTGHGYRFVAPLNAPAQPVPSPLLQADSSPQPPALAPIPPLAPARLIGRTQALETLSLRLREDRFMTVAGPGGIGKTSVAIATAHHLQSSYEHGVCFVDLGSVSTPAAICGALAAALGLASGASDPLPGILRFLTHRHMLIVLDNCEHVIETAAVLAQTVLGGAANVRILATSREPLRAMNESVFRLAPLEIPPPAAAMTAAEALGFSAVQLFVERAMASAHLFELSDADVPVVVDICRRLDGLPLAIELAATRMDVFGLRGLAARLDDCLGILTRGHRTAIPRHRTLRATLDWSYAILPRAEQVALCRLSVFAGSFDAAAARTVVTNDEAEMEDVVDLLTDLVSKSLLTVRIDDDQAVYQLLRTSRAYAVEKLQDSDECNEIRRRHSRYCRTPGFESASMPISASAADWLRQSAASAPDAARGHEHLML